MATFAVVRFRENCFVRDAPSVAGAVLGVVQRGEALPGGDRGADGGWLAVDWRGARGWVSGRFAAVERGAE